MEYPLSNNKGVYFILLFLACFLCIDSSCVFPSSLVDEWYSSNGGELTFTSTTFSNYKIASFGSYTFTCVVASGSKYVSKSDVFYVFNLPFEAYLCMDLRKVTSSKYYYYQPTSMLKDAEYARIKIYLNNTVAVTDINTVCELSDYSVVEYNMLLKNNTISSQKIQCPDAFLGKFKYTYDSGSGNQCSANNGSSELDACSDNTKMTFDYSLCSQIQAYSVGGVVNCLYYSTSGSTTSLYVFNLDSSTDESTYFRFTCYVIQTINSVVYATQYPQTCHYGQNATYVNATGAYLTFTADSTCVPDDDSTASASIALIVVIVILLLIIILAIIFAIYMYRKRKEEEKQRKLDEERALRENTLRERKENPDLRPDMDLGLPDDSKYNIDRLVFSDDKMVTPSNIEIERMRSQGFEGYDSFDDEYMDEFTRQNLIDASVFLDKRQRLDTIDEYEVGENNNTTFMKRFKELARKRIKKKKKTGGKSKSKKKSKKGKDGKNVKKKRLVLDLGTIDGDDWDTDDDGDDDEGDAINIPGQVEVTDNQHAPAATIGPILSKRSLLSERKMEMEPGKKKGKKKSKKKKDCGESSDEEALLEPIDTVTPRLIHPNLRPDETENDKEKKTPSSKSLPSVSRLKSFRSMRKAKVNNWTGDEDLDLPLYFEDPKLKDLPPLQRVNRKKNPMLWSDILAKYGADLNLPNDPKSMRWSENKWKHLLEELYTDKKYFDYMKKSGKTNPAEKDVVRDAKHGLGYLYNIANFWKEQEPIPVRPPSWRSHSFVQSAGSTRAKTPRKSKSFVNSTSIKSRRNTYDDNSGMSSSDNFITTEMSKPSRKKSTLRRGNSMISDDVTLQDRTALPRQKTNIKREKSIVKDNTLNGHSTDSASPNDNGSKNAHRHKRTHVNKKDNADMVYKMDTKPKTPMTQIRLDTEREESSL